MIGRTAVLTVAIAATIAGACLVNATTAHADPITGLIVAAIGLSGTAATIATAALNIALAVGISLGASALMPKQKSTAQTGAGVGLEIDTNATRRVWLGRAANPGRLEYWQFTGADNKTLQMVIGLADHECHALVEVWVDGKARSWNSETTHVSGYDGKLRIRWYSGSGSQTVDTGVRDASGGRWTNNEVGHHVCYAVVEADYDEKLFSGGIPQIVFVMDGAKLYDPRFDSTAGGSGSQRWGDQTTYAYSANNAVVAYNVLRGIFPGGQYLMGLRAPGDTIRADDFESAANACDESVNLAAGGTEPRYRCGCVVRVGPGLQAEREAIDLIIAGMAGDIICSGGIYRIMAGVARSSVATLSDDDFITTEPMVETPRQPRTELANAITASFADPVQGYNIVPLPMRFSTDDEDDDGGYRWARSLDLSGVFSRTQAQRVMEYRRREARRQMRAGVTLKARHFGLEVGDWITINSDRRGWSSRVFRIGSSSDAANLTTGRTLVEMDSGIDDWSTGMELPDDQATDLPSGGPSFSEITGLSVSNVTIIGSSGAQIPALSLTWTPITDPTAISISVEYRAVGDTIAMTKVILDPTSSAHLVTGGIQGGIEYEARMIPVTRPERAMNWTSWEQTSSASDPHVVDYSVIAEVAEDILDGIVKPVKLSLQVRCELELVTARENARASVAEALAKVRSDLDRLAGVVADTQARAMSTGAFVQRQEIIRQTESESFAQDLVQVGAALTDPVTGLSATASAVQSLTAEVHNGETGLVAIASAVTSLVSSLNAFYGVQIQAGGRIGFFNLVGTPAEVDAIIGVDRLFVVHPDVNGGDPLPLLDVAEVGGEAEMFLNGRFLAKAIEAGVVNATTGTFGRLTSGVFEGTNFYLDTDTGEMQIG